MKQITALKLTCVGAFVATLGVGCASSGYARYDADQTDMNQGVGVSAGADIGTESSASINADADLDHNASIRTDSDADFVSSADMRNDGDIRVVDESAEGEARVTVSALSLTPETRANWMTKFPFYDQNKQIRSINTYTFAVPDPEVETRIDSGAPEFSASLPPGSVFVEAAGGAGEVRTGRVIQHSPNPTR